jgi:hypothetical protein
MVWGAGVRGCAAILVQWHAPSYPTIVYPTLAESMGLKICSNSLFLFLKTELIGCEIIAIDGTKAERTTVRKRTSIKEN